jgi:hypothetical protein
VVSPRDYFFNKSHRGIARRASKRKKVEENNGKEASYKVIVWNLSTKILKIMPKTQPLL